MLNARLVPFLFSAGLILFIFICYLQIDKRNNEQSTQQPFQLETVVNRWGEKRVIEKHLLPLRLVIAVISKYDQFDRRKAVRETWGNRNILESYFGKNFVRGPYFFVGKPEGHLLPEAEATKLKMEQEQFNDVIEVDAIDTFGLLTPKMFQVFNWIDHEIDNWKMKDNFLNSKGDGYYLLKADDDAYIDLVRIVKLHYGKLRVDQMKQSQARPSLFCHIIRQAGVVRDETSKLFVPYSVYNSTHYPTYCSGIAYMFDSNMLKPLLETAKSMTSLPNEDTFFTGTVAENLEFEHKQLPVREFFKDAGTWDKDLLCKVGNGEDSNRLVLHRLSFEEMKIVFDCFQQSDQFISH